MKISRYNTIKKYKNQILVYNSYTKASIFLTLDSDTLAFENIEGFNKLEMNFQKLLLENGFVLENSKDELSELKYIFEKSYFDNDFLNIVLVPSLACNFKCPYCFEKDNTCVKEDVEKYFESLKKYAEKHFKTHRCVQISLFGGEPLLYANECIDFLKWVDSDSKKREYSYFTSIVTNGSLVNESTIKQLLKHNLRSLQITIDSDKETHDRLRIFKNGNPSFEILLDKIRLTLDLIKDSKDFQFVLRINLNNANTKKVSKSLAMIEERYRSKIDLLIRVLYNTNTYFGKNSNNVSELEEYFDLGKELGFGIIQEKYNYQSCEGCADSKFFYLMPDLSMWKCINDLKNKNACIGKINGDGEPEVVSENIINWYNNASSAFSDEECLKCKLLPDCLGGCIMYKCKNHRKLCRTFDMASKAFIY